MRKIIFWCHVSVALAIGWVLLSMAVTGMIMAFEPQLVDWSERHVRPRHQVDPSSLLSMNELVQRAQEFRQKNPSSLSVRAESRGVVGVGFGKAGMVYVQADTGQILGTQSKMHDFMHTMEDWHRWLGSKEIGKPITGVGVLGFLFLMVSGFYLWWPRQWSGKNLRAITVFDWHLSGRARHWNWHQVIGLWCWPIFLVTTLTGIVMSYDWANRLLFKMTGHEAPVKSSPVQSSENKKALIPSEPILVEWNLIWEKATHQVPQWESIAIRVPQKPDSPVMVSIVEANAPHPYSRSQLSLDAQTGDITKWEPFAEQNLGKKVRSWVRPLHTGEAWGWVGQLLAFLASAGCVLLIWTGYSLAWYRFHNWLRARRNA